jgi:UDP-N-acetylmuramoyl-L-alanyl-D-glutamate--2,6-diaminopimelate ligase
MFAELIYTFKRPFHLVKTGLLKGLPAQICYGFPAKKLKIICITGTDGKTTSSTLLYQVLKQAGKKVALLSTVAAYIGQEEIDTGFHVTTPDPAQLQKFMRRMLDEGYEYLVLEATSHGIYQYRLWGVTPFLVGFTNITNEHLDYHVNYRLYLQAKAELANKAKTAVINADDQMSFSSLKKKFTGAGKRVLTYSHADKLPPIVSKAISARFSQEFNKMNARLVFTLAREVGLGNQDIAAGIAEFPGVPGRMQEIGSSRGVRVIVDFSHTANGLHEALTHLRKNIPEKSRLIAVFGCAGLRDRQKRPVMGKTATHIADLAVFTAEDPRTEDVWSIIRQMKQDVGNNHAKIISLADRREAIFFAITQLARPGDVVGLFGKGHEKSMCYGTTEYSWSDAAVGQEALDALAKKDK